MEMPDQAGAPDARSLPGHAPPAGEHREFDLEGVNFDTLEADDNTSWGGYSAVNEGAMNSPPADLTGPDHATDYDAAGDLLGEGQSTLDADALNGDVAFFDLNDLQSMDLWQPIEIPNEDLQGVMELDEPGASGTFPEADPLGDRSPSAAEERPDGEAFPSDETAEGLPEAVAALDELLAPAEEPDEAAAPPLPVVPDVPPPAEAKTRPAEPAAEPPVTPQTDPAQKAPETSVLPPAATDGGHQGMASEAVRVLEDLKRLGVNGAAETLSGVAAPPDAASANAVAGTAGQDPHPLPYPPGSPAGRPTGYGGSGEGPRHTAPKGREIRNGGVSPGKAEQPGDVAPPQSADGGVERHRRRLQRVLRPAAALLILLDRPFAKVSPRLKGFLGQMAVSMLATAVCLLVLSSLGLLPD